MSWLTDARFRRISYALVLGWILGLSLFLLLGSDSFSAFYPGDLPGFYVPGVIFDRGLFSELYNFDLQRSLENEFWPTAHNAYYAFAYPPYTAVLLWPLAWLTPISAKIVWTIIQLFACGGTLFFLSRLCAFSPHTRFAIYVLLLSCAPIMTSLMGAQNTCFSAFLFAGTLYFLNVDTPRGHSLAGLFAGALLYKPQFGLILIAYLLALRNWRAASGAGFMGFLFYLLGASVQGWNWPQLWLNHANSFGLQNYIVNGHQMVSLHGILFTVSQLFTNTPSHLSLVLWICTLMSFFLIAWVLLRCF
ncbi:MAG: DUF2029 domain-containing protein, partial [Bdellovibrionales bacterium]|nr:DUF2029 domain-containing protein [Bdellovibrionales bacterium]